MAIFASRLVSGDAQLLIRLAKDRVAPDVVVVDASAVASSHELPAAARAAGLPFVVDPLTHLIQSAQPATDRWASLPYARSSPLSPDELARPARAASLTAQVIEYQLEHDATAIVPPYVHIDRPDQPWLATQQALWSATRDYLDNNALRLPVLPVVAAGWRMLSAATWPSGLETLLPALRELSPEAVALAGSRVDQGVRRDERIAGLLGVSTELAGIAPVWGWNQGRLGELMVASGAAGYSCGIGWRERCDLPGHMQDHRRPPPTTFGPRPVYVPALGLSIPKRSLRQLLSRPAIAPSLICLDSSCCPGGTDSMLGDARGHAIRQRISRLERLTNAGTTFERWSAVVRHAETALRIAGSVNTLAAAVDVVTRVDAATVQAVLTIASQRRDMYVPLHAA